MATIEDLLKSKGREVHSISPQATLLEAASALAEHGIGALVVLDEGKLVGIISERDIVREARRGGLRLELVSVSEVMSADLIVGLPADDVAYVMSIMTQNRIRHLPVMAGKELAGIISIGDVVKAHISETQVENRMLRDYIAGKYPA